MADALGLVNKGIEGSGAAQLLGSQPSAFETMKAPISGMINLKWQERQKGKQREQEIKKNLQKLGDYNPLWENAKAELDTAYGGLADKYVSTWKAGGNPTNPTTEEGRLALQEKSNFNKLNNMNKAAFDQYGQIVDAYQKDPTKYDEEQFNKFLEGLKGQKTIQDRFNFASTAKPLIPKVNLFEDLSKFMPEGQVNIYENKSGVTTNIDQLPDDKAMDAAKAYLLSKPEQIDALIAKGAAKDEEDAARVVAKQMKVQYKPKSELRRDQSGGGLNLSLVGAPSQIGKVSIDAKNVFSPDGTADEISVSYNDKDLLPMEVIGRDGRLIYFKPSIFYKSSAKGENSSGVPLGKLAVKGQVFKRTSEVVKSSDVPANPFGQSNVEYSDNGNGTFTKTTFIPLANEVVDYDKNDIRFKTHLENVDMNEWVNEWNKKNAKKKGTATKAKQESSDNVKLPDVDPN